MTLIKTMTRRNYTLLDAAVFTDIKGSKTITERVLVELKKENKIIRLKKIVGGSVYGCRSRVYPVLALTT